MGAHWLRWFDSLHTVALRGGQGRQAHHCSLQEPLPCTTSLSSPCCSVAIAAIKVCARKTRDLRRSAFAWSQPNLLQGAPPFGPGPADQFTRSSFAKDVVAVMYTVNMQKGH